MKIPRWTLRVAALVVGLAAGGLPLHAQGVTTGAIAGTVTDAAGAPVEGAVVQAVAKSNGFVSSTTTRSNGSYIIPNLETGAYTVKVRRIGFESIELPVPVTLSQTTRFNIQMKQATTQLGAVTVTATNDAAVFNPTRQGVSTEVSDSLITHLPQLNRNITDLAKLVPQVIIPSSGGPSAGGMYNRLNNFTVDGASQNDRFNLGSTGGVPGGAGNGRIISADAVKEFRVLLTPTDVRQANFTGLLFNAVTKSGSNEFHGGLMYNYRHDANMASSNFRQTPVDQRQYGFQLGGPIIKDRLTFYLAPEWQTRFSAASGPFVGGTAPGTTPNITPDSIAYLQNLVLTKYGYDVGTSGKVDVENPLTNLFGRLDFQINDQHRLVLRRTDNTTENTSFTRNNNAFTNNITSQTQGFRFGSNGFTGKNKNTSNVGQIFSNFTNGISNEFLAGFNKISDERILGGALFPEIGVGVVPAGATGAAATNPTAVMTFGSEQFSPFNLATQDIDEFQDNVTIPWQSHTFTVGARYEVVKIYNNFPQALGGVWRFPNLAALNAGTPSGYAIGIPNSGNLDDVPAVFKTNMPSVYAQDQWTSGNLTVTGGIRADMPRFVSSPLDNAAFAAQFAGGVARDVAAHPGVYTGPATISTTWMPKDQILWSPRIGFNYDVNGDQTTQVRGNVGIYTAPPPFILAANALQNNGLGLVLLSCPGTNATNQPPAFTTDETNMPKACAGQAPPANGSFTTNTINLNDPEFKYPQVLGFSAGADHRLPFGFIGTVEGIYKKFINAPRIRDLDLMHPALNADGSFKTDRFGRVMYADSILLNGNVQNTNQQAVAVDSVPNGTGGFNTTTFNQGIIYLTNESKSYNYSLTGQLKRRFGNFDWTGAYTYNRAYDVQSLTSDRAISNWRNGREYSGLESADDLTTSAFERRHRVVSYGTLTVPWSKRWATDFTMYYEGVSGNPITYTSNQDLNGDGYNGNDPIYVPTNAMDTTQIRIGSLTGANAGNPGVFTQDEAAALAFDQFISSQDCLNSQRGSIMKRDSCRGPWQNRLDMSIRQALPNLCGQGCDNVSVQLDIANMMNLAGEILQHVDGVERDWGKTYGSTLSSFPQQSVLSQNTSGGSSARTAGPTAQSQPVYTFNTTVRNRGPYDFAGNVGYNLALTVRYVF
jgi:hypothetical protein